MIRIFEEDEKRHRDIFELLKLFFRNEEIFFLKESKEADVYIRSNSYIFYGVEKKSKDTKKDLYIDLVRRTGQPHRFGSMTGIRPTNPGFKMSGSSDQIRNYYKKYLVTDEAVDLICDVITKEKQCLGKYDKERFVSLYISIPFCDSLCDYCTFSSGIVSDEIKEKYMDSLMTQISGIFEQIDKSGKKVYCIFVGGGTPTSLETRQINMLFEKLQRVIDSDTEVTCEAGRADSINKEKLGILKDMGVGRICINPQTMNDETLSNINRKHTHQEFMDAHSQIKEFGFKTVNTDLIFGFENETFEDMNRSLDTIIALKPENISIHPLAVKKKRKINIRNHTNNDLDFWYNVKAELKKAGYDPYYMYRQKSCWNNFESIGFSIKEHECIYNMAMIEGYGEIIGCGSGASSYTDGKRKVSSKNLSDVYR